MFLQIPSLVIETVEGPFGMKEFAAYVLNHSPAISNRNVERLVSKALDAIDAAKDGVAEVPGESAEVFQVACGAAPYPALFRPMIGASGARIPNMGIPVGRTEFGAFHAAVEGMTAERPAPPAQPFSDPYEQDGGPDAVSEESRNTNSPSIVASVSTVGQAGGVTAGVYVDGADVRATAAE